MRGSNASIRAISGLCDTRRSFCQSKAWAVSPVALPTGGEQGRRSTRGFLVPSGVNGRRRWQERSELAARGGLSEEADIDTESERSRVAVGARRGARGRKGAVWTPLGRSSEMDGASFGNYNGAVVGCSGVAKRSPAAALLAQRSDQGMKAFRSRQASAL